MFDLDLPLKQNKTKHKDKDHISCLLFCPSAPSLMTVTVGFILLNCLVISYETNTKTENIWATDPVEIVFILFYFLDCLDLKCVPS